MEKYNKKAIFTKLDKFCHFSKKGDFLEITAWDNGEGFDVDICSNVPTRFQLTYGTFSAIKKAVKKLEE